MSLSGPSSKSVEERPNPSRIEFAAGEVRFYYEDELVWRLSVSEIALIGEHTNSDGPYLDDWFLVFVRGADQWRFEAPVYAVGFDETIEDLGTVLGSKLPLRLVRSTDFDSRVVWPPDLRGEKLYDYVSVRTGSFLRKIGQGLIGHLEMRFTVPVVRHFSRSQAPVASRH